MANTLGVYNPKFYANEALIQLRNYLGMAARVHRGFERERRAFGLGDTINIRRPSVFTAQAAPSTAQDAVTETVVINLDQWQEVKIVLTDKELAYTGQRIIDEHIAPAAYALANKIDQDLALLFKDIPWVYDLNATPGSVVGDVTGPRRILVDRGAPLDPGRIHYMLAPHVEQNFLGLSAFTQWQGAGMTGEQAQLRGSLGTRFGAEMFVNQNVQTHAPGTVADSVGALVGAHTKGATSLTFDGVTASEQFEKGDHFVIAGNAQRYALTAIAASDGAGEVAGALITPPLVQNYPDNAVVTFDLDATNVVQNLMFHRNAFALAMVPLPAQLGQQTGAAVFTATDPVSGLSLRARIYYMGDASEVRVALDVLYGVKTLDPNLAVRGMAAVSP